MLSKLYVESYRGLSNLVLDELGKVNIIAGANNVGKTSILEIIQSLEKPDSLRMWRMCGGRESVRGFRGAINFYEMLNTLFSMAMGTDNKNIVYGGISEKGEFQVEITGREFETILTKEQLSDVEGYRIVEPEEEENQEYDTNAMEISFKVNGRNTRKEIVYGIQRGLRRQTFVEEYSSIVDNVLYVSPMQHTRGMLYLDFLLQNPDMYEKFIQIMQQFDQYFLSINSVIDERTREKKYIVLSKNHKEGLLLNSYGDGMKKAMLLLSAVIKAQGGILLLDEFETAIHISAMREVFRWILETAMKLNVQIFMTSHSLEAISTVLNCCPELQKEIRMITLVKTEKSVKVRNVDGKKALQLMDEYGLELR